MKTKRLTLVTVVAEAVLEPQLCELVKAEGATGFTVTPARGEGSRGLRAGLDGGNVRVEAIVSDTVGEAIVTRLAERYFANYAVIAWLTEVSVVRGEKYLRS
jgi:nitrogen regulatory protein P-II 2